MKMLEKYGVTANELRVVGGGSKNRLWRRIIADAFQLPLRFPAEPESAALGGALQAAAVCAGVPVAEYVADNEPACEDEVRVLTSHASSMPHRHFVSFERGAGNVDVCRCVGQV
jgi:xylulokinase